MDSQATLVRGSIGRDAESGVTQTFNKTIWTNKWCSYQEKSTTVLDLYGQRQTLTRSMLYFAEDPKAEVNDLVTVTDRTGSTYKLLVRGTSQPIGRGRQWELEVERVRAPS